MARVTQKIAGYENDTIVWEAIVDTADNLTGNVWGLRCTNTSAYDAVGEVFRGDGTRKVANTALAGSGETTVNLPISGSLRIPVTFDAARKRWTGFRGNFPGPQVQAARA